jgi:cobalt-zinc-cadmium efflux system membrane fusion protein
VRLSTPTCIASTLLITALFSFLLLAGCGAKGGTLDSEAGAPPPAKVEEVPDASLVRVDHPERFPLAAASERIAANDLNVTGVVAADVSRNAPVVSLASGRVLEVRARLGDTVTKGQVLMRVESADLSSAFSDYRRAIADQTLAKAQLDRTTLLYEKGAVPRKDLEVAEDVAAKAGVDVENAADHLKVLGADISRPSPVIDIVAPASGIITEQNVTAAAGVKSLDNSPNLFTISDLSNVWILCDVYENDLPSVNVGETADVRLNSYPDRVFAARISNISPILDPATRTAKVRLEMRNPGPMRLGMFVTATFHGRDRHKVAVVPASAILHLHDRDWVYVPAGEKLFRRRQVSAGKIVADNLQEIRAGLRPGDAVVTNALELQNTSEQ